MIIYSGLYTIEKKTKKNLEKPTFLNTTSDKWGKKTFGQKTLKNKDIEKARRNSNPAGIFRRGGQARVSKLDGKD